MLFPPETHAENPPATWRVGKCGRRWSLTDAAGAVLESFDTKRAAEAARTSGHSAELYEKERRWYAGENVPGWKPSPYPKSPA
jgi:hypothetical protein